VVTGRKVEEPEVQMEFSKGRMAALRVLYFIIILLLLILAKARWGFSDTVFLAAVLAGLFAVAISYPLQLKVIYSVAYKRRELGDEAMVGLRGKALERLSPEGRVKVRGEIWKAISVSGEIAKGEEVTVQQVEGLTLRVRRAGEVDASLDSPLDRSGARK